MKPSSHKTKTLRNIFAATTLTALAKKALELSNGIVDTMLEFKEGKQEELEEDFGITLAIGYYFYGAEKFHEEMKKQEERKPGGKNFPS